MRVVDTSAWLEWLSDSALGRKVGLELPSTEAWIVPTIVQYELARCVTGGVAEGAAHDTIALSPECGVTSLSARPPVQGAEIAKDHRPAMADPIIYATAVAMDGDR